MNAHLRITLIWLVLIKTGSLVNIYAAQGYFKYVTILE